MLTLIFTTNLINIMKKETTATKAPKTTKRAYTKTNVEEAPKQQEVVTVEETEEETKEEVEEVEQPVNKYGIPRTGLPKFTERIPDETLAIALLVKNNAEVKRFTALNILNWLMQKGEISGNHRYVVFKFDKFAVRCNGLTREYTYKEPFFINALIAAFTCLAHSAEKVIGRFVQAEGLVLDESAKDDREAMIEETSKGI